MSDIQRLDEGISIMKADPGWRVCQVLVRNSPDEPLRVVEDPIVAWALELTDLGRIQISPVIPFQGIVPYWHGMLFRSPDGQYFDDLGQVEDLESVERYMQKPRAEYRPKLNCR